jgi:hypothetical protein
LGVLRVSLLTVAKNLARDLLQKPVSVSLFAQAEKKGSPDTLVGQCAINLSPLALGETKQLVYKCAWAQHHWCSVLTARRYGGDSSDPPPPGLATLTLSLECDGPILSPLQVTRCATLVTYFALLEPASW